MKDFIIYVGSLLWLAVLSLPIAVEERSQLKVSVFIGHILCVCGHVFPHGDQSVSEILSLQSNPSLELYY